MSTRIVPADFKLERYFAKYEFTTKYPMCCSDPEGVLMADLLQRADGECLNMWQNLSLQYTEVLGHPILRKEIAALYMNVNVEDTMVCVPQEGIYLSMKCLMQMFRDTAPGNNKPHVIVTYPGYQSLYENLRADGADISFWMARYNSESGWSFDLKELARLVRSDTKLLVVNFPHNPTSWVPTVDEWGRIVHICSERNMYLFSDEMYRLTNNDGTAALPSASTLYEKAISLSGLSKTFSMPGLRIGWLCTRDGGIMEKMASFKDYLSICASAPSEILAIITLRNRDYVLNHTMGLLKKNMEMFEEFIKGHNQFFEWHRPSAGTVGFIKLKPHALKLGQGDEKGGATSVCERLIKDAGILLIPGSSFEFDDNFVRVGFGRKNFKDALTALGHFLQNAKA